MIFEMWISISKTFRNVYVVTLYVCQVTTHMIDSVRAGCSKCSGAWERVLISRAKTRLTSGTQLQFPLTTVLCARGNVDIAYHQTVNLLTVNAEAYDVDQLFLIRVRFNSAVEFVGRLIKVVVPNEYSKTLYSSPHRSVYEYIGHCRRPSTAHFAC